MGLRLKGDVDSAALGRALDRLVARHKSLRTTFVYSDGQPTQRIADEGMGFALKDHDLRGRGDAERELQRLAVEESETAFDLEAGPLARGRLIRLADREHALLITLHRIVSDDWSMGVFKRELSELYGAFRDGWADPLPELAIQYPDYAVWQRRRLSGELLQSQSEYWRRILTGAPPVLDLPADRRRPTQRDFAAAFLALELDKSLTARLKALSRRHGTTLFNTLLASWAALLARLSGQRDLMIGAPMPHRVCVEVEPLIGVFVNTLALRLDLSGEPDVGELLDRVKTRVLEAQQHQGLPFERVAEIVRTPCNFANEPVFQVTFDWQDRRDAELNLAGLNVAPIDTLSRSSEFDLTLSLAEDGGGIVGGVEYATAVFERTTVERYAGYLRRLLEAMASNDARAVDRLPLLSAAERRQLLVEWNATNSDYPQDKCVHELFEAQAARTPDAVAITYEDEQLTYAELNSRANRLAHHLRTLGVRPDDRVAICVERGIEMLIGLLAILKAGGSYVPLDPAYPADRLAYMLEDSAPAAALSHGLARAALDRAMAGIPMRPPVLDLQGEWMHQTSTNPDPAEVGLTSRNLAYIMYTSGSTGQPKGVMIEHRNVVRLFAATECWFHFDKKDVWTLFHSFAFDFSVWEIWGALIYGGRLVVVPLETARLAEEFYQLLYRESVTVVNQNSKCVLSAHCCSEQN